MVAAGKGAKAPQSHAQKLVSAVRDTRDLLLLLALLLVILAAWDAWLAHDLSQLEALEAEHARTRRIMDADVTPEFARRALDRQTKRVGNVDLRERMLDYIDRLSIKFEQGGTTVMGRDKVRINQPQKTDVNSITRVETVDLDMVKDIELSRLVELLVAIKNGSGNNTWCTAIDGLVPSRDSEGFAVVTGKNEPVYNVRSLRISRFTEIPRHERK